MTHSRGFAVRNMDVFVDTISYNISRSHKYEHCPSPTPKKEKEGTQASLILHLYFNLFLESTVIQQPLESK